MQDKDNLISAKSLHTSSIQSVFSQAEKSESTTQQKSLLRFYEYNKNFDDNPFDEKKFSFEYLQTTSRVPWSDSFKYLLSVKIVSKKTNSSPSQYLISVYHYLSSIENLKNEFILCYGGEYINSQAKLIFSEDSHCLVVNAINNTKKDYRIGSFLMQIAVEKSLQKGFAGKVELTSSRQSGQFYFKLGFVPKNKSIYDKLSAGENVDGEEMYLPENAIRLWKAVIAKSPILLTNEEITKYCFDHHTTWCSMFKRAIPLGVAAVSAAYVYTNCNSV